MLRVKDVLATVEEMVLGNPTHVAFDIAFVDADKMRLAEYVDELIGNDHISKKGGMILVNNVLRNDLVHDTSSNNWNDSDDNK